MRIRAVVSAALGALMIVGAGVAPAVAAPPPDRTGLDISYPQCHDQNVPAVAPFWVIGVNGGLVFRPNSCLADELGRAGRNAGLYANTANPGPGGSSHWPSGATTPRACPPAPHDDTVDCAFDYGWLAARDSLRTAADAFAARGWGSAAANDWWLDVETTNSWRSDVNLNAAALEGAVAALNSAGVGYVGFYSTPYQWKTLVGGTKAFAAHPNWVAGASDATDARSRCAPSSSFTGGPVVMTQYVATYDTNYACPAGTNPTPPAPSSSPPASSAAPTVQRVAGADRVGTAIAASRDGFGQAGSARAVIVARSDPGQFADALSGVPLAATLNGPLLLTPGDHLRTDVGAEIDRVAAAGATVYLLGGTAALGSAVAASLGRRRLRVVRLGGNDRYETAAIIAGEGLHHPRRLFEASGVDFPDALAAGAAAHGGALLLTAGAVQAPATARYLRADPGAARTAVGGPAAAADPGATAVVGADRYDTAAKLAQATFASPKVVGLASGADYPDALGGGADVANSVGPLLLVAPDHLPGPARAYLGAVRAGIHRVVLFGGRQAVTDAVITETNRVLAPN